MPPPSTTMRTTTIHLFLLFLLLHNNNGVTTAATPPNPIKTVVILVMENRSFDHMLGYLKTLNPKINGISPENPPSIPLSTTNKSSPLIKFSDSSQFVVEPDPGHSFQAIREQIFGSADTSANPAPMNGFAQEAYAVNGSIEMVRHVMSGYKPEMVAVYKTLAQEFAVFDRWFASVPTSTQPNRMFVHSATSSGATSNIPALLAKGYPQRTIFENLHDNDHSFKIYFQNIPATLFFRNLRKLKFVPNFTPYNLFFKSDAKKGKLPNYAVIEQKYMDTKQDPATDDHPSHDVYQGQMFIKEVYETLRASPQWNETLLVITYDEHGGFYDHVATPTSGVPSPDDIVGPEPFLFKFDRLGVRVPTIMVSPWIDKNTVVSKPDGPYPTSEYEHSSIPATVKKIFNLPTDFLTKRDAWAGTFESVVQKRSEPRTDCPEQLPTPVRVRQTEADEEAKLSEFQQELLHLAAVLKGENIFTRFLEKILKKLTVKQGKEYMEDAVKRFLHTGSLAKKMGVDDEQIVQMRPSLTSRSTKNNFGPKRQQP